MKKGKRLIALFLVTVMVMLLFVGCKSKKVDDGKTVLKIAYWNLGLGREWIDNLATEFEKQNPEYRVEITASAAVEGIMQNYRMPDIDETDLYFIYALPDNDYLEPMDDVLDYTPEGESKTIREKFNPGYLKGATSRDGNIYYLTYGGGAYAFAYNKDLFEDAGIKELPRTTDELVNVCQKLQSKSITPLCHFVDGGYYNDLLMGWTSQYNGSEYMLNNYWPCKDEQGNSPSIEVFNKKDGRYYALKDLERILKPEYTLSGSNSKSHTEVQTEFIYKRAAMMYTGSWLVNEMSMNDTNLSSFRMPVVSAIINKLSTVKNDAQLSSVIAAIDKIVAGEKQLSDYASGDNYVVDGLTVSAADWNILMDARGVVNATYAASTVVIPYYSKEIEGAQKFLQLLYSDKGLDIYLKATKTPLPIAYSDGHTYDTSTLTEFEQKQFEYINNFTYMVTEGVHYNAHEIFTYGGAHAYCKMFVVPALNTNSKEDFISAEKLWEMNMERVEQRYSSWVANIESQ